MIGRGALQIFLSNDFTFQQSFCGYVHANINYYVLHKMFFFQYRSCGPRSLLSVAMAA